MTDVVIVLTTIADERADEIATRLINERLAACVNVHAPMQSIYRWKGRIERESERQLFIKTRAALLDALQTRLREMHPYELPEFIVLRPETVEAEYERWLISETSAATGGG